MSTRRKVAAAYLVVVFALALYLTWPVLALVSLGVAFALSVPVAIVELQRGEEIR